MTSKLYHEDEQGEEDHGGVHINSGVPNFAFYKIAMALGGHSWERAGQIWYAALTDTRLQRPPETIYEELPTFADFANLTVEHARDLYKTDVSIAEVVQKAWKVVEVL